MRHEARGIRDKAPGKSGQLAVRSWQFAVGSWQYILRNLKPASTLDPVTLTLIFFIILFSSFQLFSQVAWNKRGGVCYRIDDNNDIYKYQSFDSLFGKYNYKFCTAINLESATWTPGYLDDLKLIWAKGHEFMDHTPNHSTCAMEMTNLDDTALYSGNPYVDHINYNKICFKWGSVDITSILDEGLVNVFDNLVISTQPGQFYNFNNPTYIPMLFIPETNSVYTWLNLQNLNPLDPDSLTLYSFWEEPVSIGTHLDIPYHRLTSFDVKMPQEVLVILGERVLTLCTIHSIERPWSWIQPYGNYPLQTEEEIALSMGAELEYTGGATYYEASYKTYNEYNPNNDKQFALKFGDFTPNESTAEECKARIANGIAKHRLQICQDHFVPNTPDWSTYMQRIDSLLSWMLMHNIPVYTQREWTSILFDSVTNPFINIFPLLQTDLNDDQIPDGYQLDSGEMIYDDGVPQSDNISVQMTSWGNFFKIIGLGGLEKGNNLFTVYTKGSPGTVLWLKVNYPETGGTTTVTITADEGDWTQHTAVIDIPEEASVVNVEMECHTFISGEVRISGMELRRADRPLVMHESISLMTNQQFPLLDLDTIIYDPTYALQVLTISVFSPGVLTYNLDPQAGTLLVSKPFSFWEGSDSLLLKAVNPAGGADSSWLVFTATQTSICYGQSVSLNLLNPPAGATFLWTAIPSDPSLVQPTIANPTVSPKQTTVYSVEVTSPGLTYSEDITVSVYTGTNVTLTGPLPAYCANASPVQLYGDPIGGVFSGKGVTGDLFYPVAAAIGQNILYYTVSDPSGCTGEDSLTVIIQPIPVVKLPADTSVCHWQTVILDVGPGYDSYLWSTGAITSSVAVNATGMSSDSTRLITLIVTKNGCPAIVNTTISFTGCVGIEEFNPSCLRIYPNPVFSTLSIENSCTSADLSGTVMDILGNKRMAVTIRPGRNNFDITTLSSGLYMLSIKGDGVAVVARFVKVPL